MEIWTNARPWESRRPLEDSRDYIEIIPGSRKSSQYATKEVDVNTVKVKYYEDYTPTSTPTKTRFSARTSSGTKERGYVEVSDWQPTSPPGSSTLAAHSHRHALSKPPPIEVPGTEGDDITHMHLRTPDLAAKPPGWELNVTPPSSAVSEDAGSPDVVPSSPQASDAASFSVPDQVDSGGDHDPAMAMEQLVLPEAHRANGEEANGASMTHSDSLSVSNEVLPPGEDTSSPKRTASGKP